ncbi:ABC transporter ATP-binding protein [Vibrio mangrovi]|uniref:ABC transporter ATP-binding protein n=1 Tax=Vibrio mangrovi TaxID=474394 RepID=A0A1Y6IXF3_9VIBR|nr:ABC transporter ATP-binding protein [Vibrio mangrovi]MDW6002825.1 ABC transporter ATP-binding protein [Vibrio mangrovi]SMS02316.1 putative ABC transporter ATP-binding protein/MT1014 [Vibrio mangrovi]
MKDSQPSGSEYVIELSNAQFRWADDAPPTIDIEHLTVSAGEHLFIKGPSGCGKSTLLALLTGINTCQSGSVSVLNHDLSQLTSRQRDRFRADHIGYIFQQFNLLPYLSVIDNVLLPCHFSELRRTNVSGSLHEKARQLLTGLKLPEHLLTQPVVELSIGQQQRVAAARALIGSPKLIIADEPTSALDYDNRSAFIELLMEEADQVNATLIFVSHDPTLESMFNRSINLPQLNLAGKHV